MAKTKPVRGSTEKPDHIMISFYDDSRYSIAITWRTCAGIKSGYAEYHTADGKTMTCEAESRPFTSDIDENIIHTARLKNLTPGTRYFYTCGDENNRSAEFSFETQSENTHKFTFLALADFQKGEPHDLPDYSYLGKFIKSILKEHPEIKFILSAGDSTDCGQHEQQWNGMFAGLEGIIESVPFMLALGNHDNRGFEDYEKGTGRYYAEPAEFFCNQFCRSYPDNGAENWKTENYSFDYGDAHFIVFSINGPEETNEWAIKDLKKTGKNWKLGTYHFPIYYSGTDCQNDDAYPVMRESMEMCDIMFSGHEHNFSRSCPIRNEEIFDRPSQGTVHYMLGNGNCNPPGARTLSKVWHSAFFPQEENVSAYALVEVEADRVTLTEMLDDGRTVDKCVIDKKEDIIYPYALAPRFNRPRMLFKGMDPGLAQVEVPPENKDGVWFIAAAVLASFIGADVRRSKDCVEIELYGHRALFQSSRDSAETESGILPLGGCVYRGRMGQLYVPADGFAKAFGMKWCYSERNNFLSFEHESESRPVPVQP